MNNKLKKFIWDNQNEFDDKVPSEKVWQNVEAGFHQKMMFEKFFSGKNLSKTSY